MPPNHPLRKIREFVRGVPGELNRSLSKLYASEGRPSIPPEQLLSALLLQVFYGIRSERRLMEQLDYNLLYRWFVGLSPDGPAAHRARYRARSAEVGTGSARDRAKNERNRTVIRFNLNGSRSSDSRFEFATSACLSLRVTDKIRLRAVYDGRSRDNFETRAGPAGLEFRW